MGDLKAATMSQIMTIKIHSANIEEFDPTPAIHRWNLGSNRRPLFKASVATKCQTAVENAEFAAIAGKSDAADGEPELGVEEDEKDSGEESDLDSMFSDDEDDDALDMFD